MEKNREKEEPLTEEADLQTIEGELVADGEADDDAIQRTDPGSLDPVTPGVPSEGNQQSLRIYLLLPLFFLTAALLGGLRISSETGEFIFVRPALVCLIFATAMLVLFFRTGLIELGGWFSESLPTLQNAANSAVLVSLFAATVQIFNSLIPEQGLPFWVVSFCFLWTLGVSYFNVASAVQLVRTSVAMFVLAFLTKYFLLLNLTSESSGNWFQRLWDDPAREAMTYFLDLPRFAPSTGYIQFFAVGLFLIGLFLLPRSTRAERL